MAHRIKKQNVRTHLSLLSLIGVIALTGCNRMPNPFNSDPKTPAPRMQSVMHNDQTAGSMQPAFGVNTSNLFSENIRADSARLDRLENAVQNMRNEFDDMRPSINRLVAIEDDVQTLIAQLEAITQSSNRATAQPVSMPQPAPQKAVPVAKKTSKKSVVEIPALSGNPAIYGMRIGEHPGKTRMVLDLNAPASFTTDIDNNENILTVEINDAQWTATAHKSLRNSPFIASYHAENMSDGSGVILAVQLKQDARIAYQESVKALSGNGRRIVIDLAQ